MLRLIRATAILALCLFGTAAAQWMQVNGPYGGPISRLVSNPTNGYLFAIANGSVFRSTDAGVTWTPLFDGTGGDFTAVAIASSGTKTYLWGSTPSAFLFYSSNDYGDTWTPRATNGLPQFGYVNGIAVSGSNVVVGDSENGGYYSSDDGDNWTQVTGLPAQFQLAYFAEQGPYLYGGSAILSTTRGIYRSADHGVSWTSTNTSFMDSTFVYVTSLTANASGVFASTALGGVRRTTDSGGVWTKI